MTKEYESLVEEVQKQGGILTSVTIEIPNTETHKINDNYIKVGCNLTYECALKENADVNAVTDALDAYTRAKGDQSLREQKQAKGISATVAQVDSQPGLMPVATPPVAPVAVSEPAFGPPATETAPVLEETEPIEVVKFTLARRTDKKFQLELYQNYGDKVGQYPELKFVASREDMWNLVGDFVQTFDMTTLPVEHNVKWYADWEHGREFTNKDGETKRYKDLTGLRQR